MGPGGDRGGLVRFPFGCAVRSSRRRPGRSLVVRSCHHDAPKPGSPPSSTITTASVPNARSPTAHRGPPYPRSQRQPSSPATGAFGLRSGCVRVAFGLAMPEQRMPTVHNCGHFAASRVLRWGILVFQWNTRNLVSPLFLLGKRWIRQLAYPLLSTPAPSPMA